MINPYKVLMRGGGYLFDTFNEEHLVEGARIEFPNRNVYYQVVGHDDEKRQVYVIEVEPRQKSFLVMAKVSQKLERVRHAKKHLELAEQALLNLTGPNLELMERQDDATLDPVQVAEVFQDADNHSEIARMDLESYTMIL